jgi:hypothetical protein
MSHGLPDFSDAYQPPFRDIQTTRPRRSGKMWLLIAGVIVSGGLLLVCCGGLGALGYFGLGVITTEIEDQLRDNPVLRDKVGDIQSFDMDLTRSVAADEEDVWVYQVQGSKAQGVITVNHVTDDDGNEQIQTAKLKLSSGEEFDLVPTTP